MKPSIRHIIMKRIQSDYGNDFANDFANDMARGRRDMRDMRDMEDERRGSNRRVRRRDRNDERHFDDEEEDFGELRLPKHVIKKWKHNLENDDGTKGPHFKKQQLYKAIDAMNLAYDTYTEEDVCLMANVLYSDLCEVFKSVIPPDKEEYYWVAAAKKWLEDEDAEFEGSEKVAVYYYTVVNPYV